MWCSFTTRPLILRCYGSARTIHPRDPDWDGLIGHWDERAGARQVYDMQVDMVQTSCGYGVPFMDFRDTREAMATSAKSKGPDGIRTGWAEKNVTSIDGDPTGIFE